MAYTGSNKKENVSTTRGVQGGYIFRAATTVADVPSSSAWTPSDAGWLCLGYIPEDGFTEGVSQESSTTLRDINRDLLDDVSGNFTETLNVAFMEIKKDALAVYYGSSNVTDAAGELTVEHNWGESDEEMQYALLLLLKNDRKWVKHIPKGKVTDRADFTGNKTTAAQHEVTITYLADEDGVTAYDYFESTETSS